MRLIRDILAEKMAGGKPVISFEFFTPKTEEGDRNLADKVLPELAQARPDYVSVTYGAGGSTQSKTFAMVDSVQRKYQLPAMAHLTCVNATRDEIGTILSQARALNIQNILALRGDPPGGVGEFKKVEGGFEFAYELVDYLRQFGGFSAGVAGFPEGHTACKAGKQADWQHLQAKIERGADFVLTQLFFDNQYFYEMRDYLTARGVRTPICPGIIPILSTAQIKRMTTLCGAKIPTDLAAALDRFGNDDEATAKFGIDYATRQCADLLAHGVPGIHFYTMNKSQPVLAILKNLGLA